MRVWTAVGVALALGAAPARAQVTEPRPVFSLYVDGAMMQSSSDNVLDNLGIGGSVDMPLHERLALRFSGAYDRATAGGTRTNPNQFVSVAGDLVFFLMNDPLVRPYVFAGGGITRHLAHTEVVTVANLPKEQRTTAYTFAGPQFGVGLELGPIFMQYRMPPRPNSSSAGYSSYELFSLGVRF